MREKQGLIVTGGRSPASPLRFDSRDDWCVVAADSGLDLAIEIGLTPDAIVGDMDSIADQSRIDAFPDAFVARYPQEKDYTDTEIACDYLRNSGVQRITIVGGGGGRLDHLLGIVSLFERDAHPARWLNHRDEVLSIDTEIVIECAVGDLVSLFPVGCQRCTMRSEGLKWPLDELEWRKGDVGISNECIGERCRVTMTEGRLILVRSLPAEIVLR